MRAIRRSLNLVALLAVGACATASAGIGPLAEPLSGWEPIAVSFEPTPLRAPSYRTGPVRFAGGVVLRSEDPRFGGLSDLRLDASGGLLAVTDAGDLITAQLILDTSGRLAGVGKVRLRRLTERDGLPISDRARGDADDRGSGTAAEGRR